MITEEKLAQLRRLRPLADLPKNVSCAVETAAVSKPFGPDHVWVFAGPVRLVPYLFLPEVIQETFTVRGGDFFAARHKACVVLRCAPGELTF